MSRTPSFGLPIRPACQLGLGVPAQVPLTTPELNSAGEPLAQPLGPPLPEAVLRKFWNPAALLQKDLLPYGVVAPL